MQSKLTFGDDNAKQYDGEQRLTAHVLLDSDAAVRKTLVTGGVDGVDKS
jgi:hypothetical protein